MQYSAAPSAQAQSVAPSARQKRQQDVEEDDAAEAAEDELELHDFSEAASRGLIVRCRVEEGLAFVAYVERDTPAYTVVSRKLVALSLQRLGISASPRAARRAEAANVARLALRTALGAECFEALRAVPEATRVTLKARRGSACVPRAARSLETPAAQPLEAMLDGPSLHAALDAVLSHCLPAVALPARPYVRKRAGELMDATVPEAAPGEAAGPAASKALRFLHALLHRIQEFEDEAAGGRGAGGGPGPEWEGVEITACDAFEPEMLREGVGPEGGAPGPLEGALRALIGVFWEGATPASPALVSAMMRRLGWDGHPREASLEAAAAGLGLTRERVRQLQAALAQNLPSGDRLYVPALEAAVGRLLEAAPLPAAAAAALLGTPGAPRYDPAALARPPSAPPPSSPSGFGEEPGGGGGGVGGGAADGRFVTLAGRVEWEARVLRAASDQLRSVGAAWAPTVALQMALEAGGEAGAAGRTPSAGSPGPAPPTSARPTARPAPRPALPPPSAAGRRASFLPASALALLSHVPAWRRAAVARPPPPEAAAAFFAAHPDFLVEGALLRWRGRRRLPDPARLLSDEDRAVLAALRSLGPAAPVPARDAVAALRAAGVRSDAHARALLAASSLVERLPSTPAEGPAPPLYRPAWSL
eukprot:tig00021234_g19410.t1